MASSRKRPRASDATDRHDRVQERSREEKDNTQAECPFKVDTILDLEAEQKKKKLKNNKRRRTATGSKAESVDDGGGDGDNNNTDPADKIYFQPSPFHPSGKFKTNPNLDVHYRVEPAKEWTEMTRYNSFVCEYHSPSLSLPLFKFTALEGKFANFTYINTVNNVKYFAENFVHIANPESLKKREQKQQQGAAANDDAAGASPVLRQEDGWVARILEIRAKDEHHVFARVYWMYWPDELPAKVRDRKKLVSGRQPYHGQSELVASNHSEWNHEWLAR